MTFTYIDGIFLAIIALFVLLGFFRGFARSVLNFFGIVAQLVISFLLCKPIANLICNWTSWDDGLKIKLFNWSSGLSDAFNVNLAGLESSELKFRVDYALSDAKFPRILRGIFKSIINITPESIADQTSITMADIVSVTLSRFIITAIVFVALFIILFVTIFILKRVFKRIMKTHETLNKTDKILGMVLGLFEGLFTIVTIFTFISLFKGISFMDGFFVTLDKSCIAGPVSNLMFSIVEKYFNFANFI